MAELLALGFEAFEDSERTFVRVSRPSSDEDYAAIVALIRGVVVGLFGKPSTEPLIISRSWWPEPEIPTERNPGYYAFDEEAPIACTACGWSGTGASADRNDFTELFDVRCPLCDHGIQIVARTARRPCSRKTVPDLPREVPHAAGYRPG